MNKMIEEPVVEAEFDTRAFRNCLGQFSTGVVVVTAQVGDHRAGVTVNSFSSLSLDPPLVLWSLIRTSRSAPVFEAAERFAINILAHDQIEVSQMFASKSDDKFAGVSWRPGKNGSPVLDGCAATFECSTQAIHEGGDHHLIVGRVDGFSHQEKEGLAFSRGRYGIVIDQTPEPDAQSQGVANLSTEEPTFGSLLFQAHMCTWRDFDELRNHMGISVSESRVLFVLAATGPAFIDKIVDRSNMPQEEIRLTIVALEAAGLVARAADGVISLAPAGKARRAAIRKAIEQHEARMLANIPAKELAVATKVLKNYVAQNTAV